MAALQGRNALVVGANGAIAAASAEMLARDGASLLLFGRSAERLAGLRNQLLATIGDAEIAIFVGDTSGEADMQAAAKAAFDLKGRLDICVSTVATSVTAPVLGLSLSDFLEGMNGSVQSNFLSIRYAAPLMTGGGSIVCVSSTAAKLVFQSMAPYCAGKAAVEQLVRVAAAELGPRQIRVNAVRPGLTRAHTTGGILDHDPLRRRFLDEIPLGRTGDPTDIAEAIRYLAGPESSWVTGQSLAVDGGNELKRAPEISDFYA